MAANPSPEEFQAAQRGDRAALESLLAHSRQDLRRYAEYHCSINDVEDAVQESLFLVARKIGHLRAIEAYASWLFRIVKRECNRLKRGLRRMVLQPSLEEIDGPHYPPPDGLLRDLARTLQAMPAHYREIVLLRDYEGLSMAEIAARLGLHLEAAKARLHRARGLARQLLSVPEAPLMPA
ncbi:RNA polymerase sigma factor [Luteimonas gilva]|uniref:RNA polymerase sigma factor n=1 Tax=Luteimonas gilva TaxID=2572684 RepID=A0A4U5JY30_9GAMM|nr:RNA polymerase sigma factor [Luteimonas gilva]TKR33708.1 RNA polymerase sigma factor [Luteimonas gilva]